MGSFWNEGCAVPCDVKGIIERANSQRNQSVRRVALGSALVPQWSHFLHVQAKLELS